MKRRLFFFALLLILPLGLFMAARAAASWRPKVVGVAPGTYDFQFSPDGRWSLATSYHHKSPYPQQNCRLFDLTQSHLARSFDAALAEFSPDSQRLITFDYVRRELRVTDTASGRVLQRWGGLTSQPKESIGDVQLQRDSRELIAVSPFRVWHLDVRNGRVLRQTKIQVPCQKTEDCTIFGDQTLFRNGQKILYSGANKQWIFDAHTGKAVATVPIVGELSPDETMLWGWEPESGVCWAGTFPTAQTLWNKSMYNPQFSSDGKKLISVTEKTDVRLIDPRTGKTLEKLKVPVPDVRTHESDPAYALSPDNNYWFMLQNDKIVRYRLH